MSYVELTHSGTQFATIDEPQGHVILNTKDKTVDDYIIVKADIPVPSGKLEITNTNEVDVSDYETAQVVDSDLIANNIREGVDILGITGTVHEGITPTGKATITSMAEIDVTNYAKAQVSDSDLVASNIREGVNILGVTGTVVPAGKNVQHVSDGGDATSTSYVAKGSAITVAKTGQYKCTWFGYASASSSTYYLSRLYVNGSSVGSTHTAVAVGSSSPIFTETLNLNAGDTIQIYARGRSSSYHHQVGLLTIEEV